MLVIMRRQEEELIINGNIKIKIFKISGNQVSIGIEAPREIPIYRGEIYEEMRLNKITKEAAILAEAVARQNDKAQHNDKDGNC